MTKVFLACPGLGTTRRGYEVSIQAIYDILTKKSDLEISLFKGGGKSELRQKSLWNLPRNSWLARTLGELLSVGNPLLGRGYYIEQLTFALSLLPHLVLGKPDAIYFSDKNLGDFLWHWRRLTKQKYKLIFCNAGPYPPPYNRWDHVQQVTSVYFQIGLDSGLSRRQQSFLPTGFTIPSEFEPLGASEKFNLRHQLNLPTNRPILLSVSAVNKSHKRLDYLINEIARLSQPRPYLVILGQLDAESPSIIQLGNEILGTDNFRVKTVSSSQIGNYYRTADVFTLTSLREGFGMCLVEAMSFGLPCLVHDYGITRFVLGEHGYFGDFTLPGQLNELLEKALCDLDIEKMMCRHRTMYERFSWDRLYPKYIKMIDQCVDS